MSKRFVVISNVNMQPLARLPGLGDAVQPSYDMTVLHSLDYSSVGAVFVHRDYLMDTFNLPVVAESFDVMKMILALVQEAITEHPSVLFIVSNIVLSARHVVGHVMSNSSFGEPFEQLESYFNSELRKLAMRNHNVIILDFKSLVNRYGMNELCSNKYYYMSRIAYTLDGLEYIRSELCSLIDAYYGRCKKVLVLDLDNTMWGGIIGEDGVNGIKLSNEGEGKSYKDFQRCVLALKDIGILLALNSKNNEVDVNCAFNSHPSMILKLDDFIVRKVNWQDKATNMREISSELGLGLDSFVFIDDNKFELDLVKSIMPEVSCYQVPDNIEDYKDWFIDVVIKKEFPKLRVTKEDEDKSRQYESYVKRKNLEQSVGVKNYISSLNIELTMYKNDRNIIDRIAQLTQKTNQFNLTTRRYTIKDIHGFIEDPEIDVWGVKYKDLYGDEGIIGVVIVGKSREITGYNIDTFLLSCRVIGRGVEKAIMHYLVRQYVGDVVKDFVASYIPTEKNKIVSGFYPSCGFSLRDADHFAGDDIYTYYGSSNVILNALNKDLFESNIKVVEHQ